MTELCKLVSPTDKTDTRSVFKNTFIDSLESFIHQGFKIDKFTMKVMHYDGNYYDLIFSLYATWDHMSI